MRYCQPFCIYPRIHMNDYRYLRALQESGINTQKIVNSQNSHFWLAIINNGFRVKWRWENERKNIHLHGMPTMDRAKSISLQLFNLCVSFVSCNDSREYVCIECKRCLSTTSQKLVRWLKYWYRFNNSNKQKFSPQNAP